MTPRIDDYVRALLNQMATEEAFLGGLRQPGDARPNGVAAPACVRPIRVVDDNESATCSAARAWLLG